jgi:hypothetical protein
MASSPRSSSSGIKKEEEKEAEKKASGRLPGAAAIKRGARVRARALERHESEPLPRPAARPGGEGRPSAPRAPGQRGRPGDRGRAQAADRVPTYRLPRLHQVSQAREAAAPRRSSRYDFNVSGLLSLRGEGQGGGGAEGAGRRVKGRTISRMFGMARANYRVSHGIAIPILAIESLEGASIVPLVLRKFLELGFNYSRCERLFRSGPIERPICLSFFFFYRAFTVTFNFPRATHHTLPV